MIMQKYANNVHDYANMLTLSKPRLLIIIAVEEEECVPSYSTCCESRIFHVYLNSTFGYIAAEFSINFILNIERKLS